MSSTENNVIFSTNINAIEKGIKIGIESLNSSYTLKEIDCGRFSNLQIQNITYTINQYEIVGVGNLVVMNSKHCSDLQMFSFVATPYYKKLPLFSNDYIYITEKRNFLIEYYDLVEKKDLVYKSYMDKFQSIKDKYSHLPNMKLKECWYDSLKPVCTAKKATDSDDMAIFSIFKENLDLFIEMEKACDTLSQKDIMAKWQITQDYTDKLVDSGGVSTNVFKNALGDLATKDFFNEVFFGTKKFKNIL